MARKTVLLSPCRGAHHGKYATAFEHPVEVFTEDAQLEASLCVPAKQTEFCLMPPTVTSCRRGQQNLRLSDYSRMDRVADFVFGVLNPRRIVQHSFRTRFSFDQGARLDRRHQK